MTPGPEEDDLPASLLVRRAGPEVVDWVAAVLGATDGRRAELADCAAAGGLFVLSDLAWEPPEPPVAAAALKVDRVGRRARFVGVARAKEARSEDLDRRLLEGVATLLRADGIETVEVPPDRALSRLLRDFGLRETEHPYLLYLL